MQEHNKEIINDIVDTGNYGYAELEDLREDIEEYIGMCRGKGYLIKL